MQRMSLHSSHQVGLQGDRLRVTPNLALVQHKGCLTCRQDKHQKCKLSTQAGFLPGTQIPSVGGVIP